jgi:glycine cleavage system H protein
MQVRGYEFPDDLHYLVAYDMWARFEDDGLVRVGATALGVALAGEIVAFLPKPVGESVEQGRAVGAIELFKTIISAKAPLSGVLVEVNDAVGRTPALLNRDPYGAGWLARIRPANWAADSAMLAHGTAVAEAMERVWQGYREDGYDV